MGERWYQAPGCRRNPGKEPGPAGPGGTHIRHAEPVQGTRNRHTPVLAGPGVREVLLPPLLEPVARAVVLVSRPHLAQRDSQMSWEKEPQMSRELGQRL